MRKIFFWLAVGLMAAVAVARADAAQPQAWIAVFGLDTADFPRVSAWVEAWDAQGQFIAHIRPADVQVSEDGHPRALAAWQEQQPGAQVVIAIEDGRALGVRDDLGVSRYQYIYNQIRSWADQPHNVPYDLSLVTSDGPQTAHLADFPTFEQALDAYKPDTKSEETGLNALSAGLKLAVDPTPHPGMGRALLWITPLPGQQALKELPQYLSLAQQSRVRVYIWLVGPPALQQDPEAQQLAEFANNTLGRLYFFSGVETLPLLKDLFAPLTHIYRLTYISEAVRGENHTLQLTVHTPQGETLTAKPVSFRFALKPPEVALLNPPQEITRVLPEGETDPARRRPASVTVQVGVSFPDNHPRSLQRVTLLVDGKPADVRTEPPYDTLRWDLRAYQHGGAHTLQAEVEDMYGLVARSQPVTVQISVPQPATTLTVTLAVYRQPLTIAIVVLAGLVLLAVLWWGGRRRPRRAAASPATPPQAEPRGASHSRTRWWAWVPRRQAVAPAVSGRALAYLVPLAATIAEIPDLTTLRIETPEVTLGSDPAQADVVVPDPSVEPLHARLWRTDEGVFFIADQRSAAGTWVNYAPVSPEGARVQEGDLVHLGRVGFRFRLKPDEPVQVRIHPTSPKG